MEASVVDQLRSMGRNPEIVAATVAETRAQIAAQQKELAAELRRARAHAKRLHGEPGADEAAEHIVILRADLKALKDHVIDEANLAETLAGFEPVWPELFPAERARVLNLLLERVDYDAPTSSVRLTFWSEGVRSLLSESAEALA
jgi:site-specific DNA recombinase